jgi:hypothetical protein
MEIVGNVEFRDGRKIILLLNFSFTLRLTEERTNNDNSIVFTFVMAFSKNVSLPTY